MRSRDEAQAAITEVVEALPADLPPADALRKLLDAVGAALVDTVVDVPADRVGVVVARRPGCRVTAVARFDADRFLGCDLGGGETEWFSGTLYPMSL